MQLPLSRCAGYPVSPPMSPQLYPHPMTSREADLSIDWPSPQLYTPFLIQIDDSTRPCLDFDRAHAKIYRPASNPAECSMELPQALTSLSPYTRGRQSTPDLLGKASALSQGRSIDKEDCRLTPVASFPSFIPKIQVENVEDDLDYDEEDSPLGSEVDENMADGDNQKTTAEIRAEKRKSKRFRLTHSQTRFLQSEFSRQAHPDAAQRTRLSKEIPGLSPRQVQVWFQNRRAKLKRLTSDDRERVLKSSAVPTDFDTTNVLQSTGPFRNPRYAGAPPSAQSPLMIGEAAHAYGSQRFGFDRASEFDVPLSPRSVKQNFNKFPNGFYDIEDDWSDVPVKLSRRRMVDSDCLTIHDRSQSIPITYQTQHLASQGPKRRADSWTPPTDPNLLPRENNLNRASGVDSMLASFPEFPHYVPSPRELSAPEVHSAMTSSGGWNDPGASQINPSMPTRSPDLDETSGHDDINQNLLTLFPGLQPVNLYQTPSLSSCQYVNHSSQNQQLFQRGPAQNGSSYHTTTMPISPYPMHFDNEPSSYQQQIDVGT